MKKIVIVGLLLLSAGVFTNVLAQEAAPKAEKVRNKFASISFVDKVITENFPGFAINYGFGIKKKSIMTFELNMGFHNSEKIGSFWYGPYYNPTLYRDGEITYKYTVIEFLVSWEYVGKISDKFQFRAGPTVGFISISGEDSYDPTEKNGVSISGIPDSSTETEGTVTGGVSAGIIWNLTDFLFLDLGVKVLANPGIKFDERTIKIMGSSIKIKEKEFDTLESQFNLGIGFRF